MFATVVVGLAASFGPTGPEEVSVQAGDADRPAPSRLDPNGRLDPAAAPNPVGAEEAEESETSQSAATPLPDGLEAAMSALDAQAALAFEERVLSAAPEEVPAAPTTEAPSTTRPSTTTTEAAEETTTSDTAEGETTTTAGDGSDTTGSTDTTEVETTETTDTTGPEDPAETTAPPTTSHPDGWVDAGHGVYVPEVLLAIRYCESRDDYNAANPSSSARGAYQFLTGSWAAYGHADRYGVSQAHLATNAQQDEAALITWQADGTRPWNASISCWG